VLFLFIAGTIRRFLEKFPDALDSLVFCCSDETLVSDCVVSCLWFSLWDDECINKAFGVHSVTHFVRNPRICAVENDDSTSGFTSLEFGND
jgi:hypothetical protein